MSGSEIIYAENFSASEWEDLKLEARSGSRVLSLPCCSAKVSLRSGTAHRQCFAHSRNQSCKSDAWSDYSGKLTSRKGRKSESLDHKRVKEIIKEVAEKTGFSATLEYSGRSPSGFEWKADVFIEKGDQKVAIEIQISPQQFSDYRIRQQRYNESGVQCLWLSNVLPEFSDKDVPVFELSKSEGVFVVDFPQFFRPELLKLQSDFRGVSLGGFIQGMLDQGIPWEHDWINKSDRLASLAVTQNLPKSNSKLVGEADESVAEQASLFASIKERHTGGRIRPRSTETPIQRTISPAKEYQSIQTDEPKQFTSSTDLLKHLNPPQKEAVLHGEGPLLILAGAGSG
ncbi:MAG: hypothetical protein HY888_00800, partial [Deltaproteobacteria bacterium]|nr:hypothetical protein [Deltaproteobacteria bacterium]